MNYILISFIFNDVYFWELFTFWWTECRINNRSVWFINICFIAYFRLIVLIVLLMLLYRWKLPTTLVALCTIAKRYKIGLWYGWLNRNVVDWVIISINTAFDLLPNSQVEVEFWGLKYGGQTVERRAQSYIDRCWQVIVRILDFHNSIELCSSHIRRETRWVVSIYV